ncbi:hypothetical protein [Methylobacterium dankookense]|uniref:Uncharacterized protein n=1 Tax=Methylobacterium dankookense TaxID=560405 RepID=A0A564G3K8_9HYPH|nr:hypothetical protein [Methylobacterium dankookense]GJD59807.1 hypothetical protein IFDJLNFL_5738 [Methylobacterium dankookense]VUF15065.1 hypothetical protein MTDSW087_04798 [Methylobacterium dankookense]
MGEQKRRAAAGHVPPEGMVNVSGRHVVELARGIMDLLDKPFDEGMQADVAAHVLVTTAVDLWRVNYGDSQVAEALKRSIDRRLEKPASYWGAGETR